jgi:hypothetical protein
MPEPGAHQIKELFRAAAGLSIDTDDVRRYREFVDDKLYDLLLMGVATAHANGRDIMQPSDLPITAGLQERIHEFEKLAHDIPIEPILEQLATHPPLAAEPSDEVEARLPGIVGGLSVGLAKFFTIVAPQKKNPATDEWSEAFRVFDLLL